MKLSCSVTDFWEAPLDEAARIVSAAGFDAIELFLRDFGVLKGGMAAWPPAKVRDSFAQYGIAVSTINIENITAADEPTWRRQVEERLREAEYAQAIGLNSINLKGGDDRVAQSVDALVAALNALCEKLPASMTVNVGNHLGNRVQNADDLRPLLAQTPERVRVLVDTGHFLSSGVDPVSIVREFGPRVGLVHLRDQEGKTPVPFGTGALRFDELFEALKAAEYGGWLVVELEDMNVPPDIVERHRLTREFVLERLGDLG